MPPGAAARPGGWWLLLGVFTAATCGLLYELLGGALASYLFGDSVTWFSAVIGVFLFCMGVGSFLSRFIRSHLPAWFVGVELSVGVLGGTVALVGFALFATGSLSGLPMLAQLALVGVLVGVEIPLVIRILRDRTDLNVTVSNVLAVDALGALAASALFPWVLLPHLGLIRAGMVTGTLNVVVALVLARRLPLGRMRRPIFVAGLGCLVALVGGVAAAGRLTSALETKTYGDSIVYAQSTAYQRLVLTRFKNDLRLYLGGHLQFSSVDEYRYHEALVHPAMAGGAEDVLILGGGDGLAAREVLRHRVRRVDLVDLDPAVTRLFASQPDLMRLNQGSLADPRVHLHHEDAFVFLRDDPGHYDVIIADLPDPSDERLGKLYSQTFYGMALRRLRPGGRLVTQATSPFRARAAFWNIAESIATARPSVTVLPYHTTVPTFGTWGFVLASLAPLDPAQMPLPQGLRYLSPDLLPSLFVFPQDMGRVPSPPSGLDRPRVVDLYRSGYHRYLD